MSATRRQILVGIAAASTAAATGGATAAPSECAELIRLGDALPGVLDRYTKAKKKCAAIGREWAPKWPLAPEPILTFGLGSHPERNLTERGIARVVPERGALKRVWNYGSPEYFEAEIENHKQCIAHILKTKSRRGLKGEQNWIARCEDALSLSRTYCAEIERIREASGYPAAGAEEAAARDALKDHVSEVMEMQPRTMEGVVIQAQALAAWGQVDRFYQTFNTEGPDWALCIARSIMARNVS